MNLDLKFIKTKRKEKGYSLQYMAKALGLSNASQYYKYEIGYYKLKADMLPLLAKILNCNIENFLSKKFLK